MARYYSPSDTNIDKIGIPPDKQVAYPTFTPEQEKAYSDLMNSTVIADYVERNPDMSESDISSYASTLAKTYPLELRVLRKIIRNEVERTKPTRLYDLDYDLQLNEALRILKEEDFKSLIKHTKTLKELQAESSSEKSNK